MTDIVKALPLLHLILTACGKPVIETREGQTVWKDVERQLTFASHGHILTNAGVWSPDGQWIVYDVRSDPAGSVFDGTRIERVEVETGEVQVLYEATNGACVGVATCSPVDDRVVFIHGPEPMPGWEYATNNRRGVFVDISRPGMVVNLDARDLTPPFTAGALRGGTHLHTFSPDGQWIVFTYDDRLLPSGQRNVGVSVPIGPVNVPKELHHHNGSHFSVLLTKTVLQPNPGSDEICRASEEAWIAGSRRAIGFQGQVVTLKNETIAEAFIVELPAEVTVPGDCPLAGTETRLPSPPKRSLQRRLTFTADRKNPGIQGPRHWLRSSSDGSRIAFLMKDDAGIVQLWTISPSGGEPKQLTRHLWSIASAFTWSPDGRWIAHIMDNSVFITDTATGEGTRLTARTDHLSALRPEACVFSPDGSKIAYVRPMAEDGVVRNQIFVVEVSP